MILNGFGAVGRALAGLLASRDDIYSTYGTKIRLVGVSDGGGGACEEAGLDLAGLINAKRESGTISGCGPSRPSRWR